MSYSKSPIPLREGQNWAPVNPLLKLEQNSPNSSNYLHDAIKELFKHHMTLEKNTWDELNSAGQQVKNFIEGKQFLMPNTWIPGQWIAYEIKNDDDRRRALNITQFYTSNCLWKWQLANPNVRVIAGVNTDAAQHAAEAATTIVDHYERRFFRPDVTEQEALMGICFGSYVWRLCYDPAQYSMTAYREIFGTAEVPMGQGYGACGSCGYSGTADTFQQVSPPEMNQEPMGDSEMMAPPEPINLCPECGSEASVEPPPTEQLPTVTGLEPVNLGDFRLDLVPFPALRWDLRYRLDDSPWAIMRERTSRNALQRLFGDVRIPRGDGNFDHGLDIIEKMAYSGQAQAGYSVKGNERRTLFKDPVTIEEFWCSPSEYAHIKIKQDEPTLSGDTIPANTSLADIFPDGIVITGLNEMNVITGIHVERHCDYMTQGIWYAKHGSGAGRGLQDLVEIQKRFNADDSQIHNYLRSVSSPAMLVIEEVLGEEGTSEYLNTPGENIPVSMTNVPEKWKLQDVVTPAFQPGNVSGQMFEYTYSRLNELAQLAAHVTEFSAGLPGVNNKTATGAKITSANANAIFVPMLQVKGQIRQRVAEMLVKQYPQRFPIERYFPLAGKKGRQAGVWLAGADLSTDLDFEVVRDSELPMNSELKLERYIAFFQMFGGAQGWLAARQMFPEWITNVERIFDVAMEDEEYNQSAHLCSKRIKQMEQGVMIAPDPMILISLIQPPISQFEPEQDKKALILSDWLDEEGQDAPLPLRMAVELLIQIHIEQAMMQQAALGMAQGMMAPPGAEGQQGQDNTAQEGSADRNHDAQQRERDRQHERDMKQMDVGGKEKVARISARTKKGRAS